MPVPTKACHNLDVRIVVLYECTQVNNLPLDTLIEAQITEDKNPVQFGVIFSSSPPDWGAYGIPVLWIDDQGVNVGRWKGMVPDTVCKGLHRGFGEDCHERTRARAGMSVIGLRRHFSTRLSRSITRSS